MREIEPINEQHIIMQADEASTVTTSHGDRWKGTEPRAALGLGRRRMSRRLFSVLVCGQLINKTMAGKVLLVGFHVVMHI